MNGNTFDILTDVVFILSISTFDFPNKLCKRLLDHVSGPDPPFVWFTEAEVNGDIVMKWRYSRPNVTSFTLFSCQVKREIDDNICTVSIDRSKVRLIHEIYNQQTASVSHYVKRVLKRHFI